MTFKDLSIANHSVKFNGKFENIYLTQDTRKMALLLETDVIENGLNNFSGKELSVEMKPAENRRSKEANSYYWILCTKISETTGHSKSYTHNFLLRKYGQPELKHGYIEYVMLPDTKAEEIKADESKTLHVKRTPGVFEGNNGNMYRMYILLKGSSEYTVEEMSKLIEGAITEAEKLGIETNT